MHLPLYRQDTQLAPASTTKDYNTEHWQSLIQLLWYALWGSLLIFQFINILFIDFFYITHYNLDSHNAHTFTPMNICMQILLLWASSNIEPTNPQNWWRCLEIFSEAISLITKISGVCQSFGRDMTSARIRRKWDIINLRSTSDILLLTSDNQLQ